MAVEIIPDKICPHCGGNEWYTYFRKNKWMYICKKRNDDNSRLATLSGRGKETSRKYRENHPDRVKLSSKEWRENNKEKKYQSNKIWIQKNPDRRKEITRKWQKKSSQTLSDSYIKNILCKTIRYRNVKISTKDITSEQVIKCRSSLEIKREFNPLKENSMYTKEQISQFQNEYDELGKEIFRSNSPSKEKSSLYSRRWALKRKIESVKDYEDLIVLGVDSSPVIEEVAPVVDSKPSPHEEIIKEFQRINAERDALLDKVNTFNNYIESLKIKLI